MKEYHQLDEIQKDLYNNQISCFSLVTEYLQRIEELKHLNAFLEVYAEEALQKAKDIDDKI